MQYGRFSDDDGLTHIIQRRSNDCAIATAAMIADVSYDIAAQRNPVPSDDRGLYPREIVRILESVTGVSWLGPHLAWWLPISRLASANYPFVAVIRRPWKWQTLHCVAIYNGYVHDPEYHCGCRMNEYQKQHWRVVQVYRPTVAKQLLLVRHYYKRQRSELLAVLRRRSKCCI